MDKLKPIISILVGLAAVFIVWYVGFYTPAVAQAEPSQESKADAAPDEPVEAKKPADPNESGKTVAEKKSGQPTDPPEPNKAADARGSRRPQRPGASEKEADEGDKEPEDPNNPLESLNLKDVAMKEIIKKLADWTGKVIIPTEEAQKIKITIYAPKKLPRGEALSMIYAALRMKGYTAEFSDSIIYIKPITEAKLGEVPTIAADYPLELIENKEQIVQKFFELKSYSPSQMGQILMPLIGEYGHISADENTGSLSVIDTVKSLMRISMIIQQYDVVDAAEIETEIFEIHNGNPEEIVLLLEKLLGNGAGSSSSRGRSPSRSPSKKSSSGAATTVTLFCWRLAVTVTASRPTGC